MATVTVTRTWTEPGTNAMIERIQRRLRAGSRPVLPVVEHFAREWKRSIDFDFRVGGRSPFVWAPNARNTIAAKGHGRQLEGKNGPRLRDSISIQVLPKFGGSRLGAGGIEPTGAAGSGGAVVQAWVPRVGELNQVGTKPHVITPSKRSVLRFEVAEDRGEFQARRARAVRKRRAGVRVPIPAGPGTKVVFARVVHHPGTPARRFIVVREGLIREAWRKPLRAYLFEGRYP